MELGEGEAEGEEAEDEAVEEGSSPNNLRCDGLSLTKIMNGSRAVVLLLG